jgi:hypothetical protein
VKAIWVDIDIGPSEPGKKPKYPDLPTAVKAILEFVKVQKLPQPSAMIKSGGGLHVYWISKTAMTPQEWQPYASGLQNLLLANNVLADSSLTTDIARILRVPGTKNYKYDPPADVTLVPTPLVIYDFPTKLASLQQYAGPVINRTAGAKPHSIFADETMSFSKFGKPNPLFDQFKNEPGLNAGIGPEERLLDPLPIFQQCGFLREALLTGGRDYDEPLWNQSVLCATFMKNGKDIAHLIGAQKI